MPASCLLMASPPSLAGSRRRCTTAGGSVALAAPAPAPASLSAARRGLLAAAAPGGCARGGCARRGCARGGCRPRHMGRRGARYVAAAGAEVDPTATAAPLEVILTPDEAKDGIRVGLIEVRRKSVVVIAAVREGSAAEAEGVRVGMRLLKVSDPVRLNEMWDVNERSSIRFVRDAIRMRRADCRLVLEASPSYEAEVEASATPSAGAAPASAPSGGAIGRGGDLLPQAGDKSEVAQRIVAREERLAEVGTRDDSKFFLFLFLSFTLPAAIILAIAFGTGYMDTLGAGY